MPPLKDTKEEMFCREYARHEIGARAVVAAGYNVRTWTEHGSTSASVTAGALLKKPKVQLRIQELKEQRARKADVSDVYVLTKLKTIVARSLGEVRPILNKDGTPTGRYEYDSAGANRALHMIGDYLQMWTPPKEAPTGNTYNTQINVYVPENDRSRRVIADGHGNAVSNSGSGAGSANGQASGSQGGLVALPSNGHH